MSIRSWVPKTVKVTMALRRLAGVSSLLKSEKPRIVHIFRMECSLPFFCPLQTRLGQKSGCLSQATRLSASCGPAVFRPCVATGLGFAGNYL